jgi:hypothetical protein
LSLLFTRNQRLTFEAFAFAGSDFRKVTREPRVIAAVSLEEIWSE